MSNYQEHSINSPFGEICILISNDSENKDFDAKKELIESVHSSKLQQSYLDNNNMVYAIEVSFYYSSCYKELDNPVSNENDALEEAIQMIIKECEEY